MDLSKGSRMNKTTIKWQNYYDRTNKKPALYKLLQYFIHECYLYMNNKYNGDIARFDLYQRYMSFIDLGYFGNKEEISKDQLKETKEVIEYILKGELNSTGSFIDLNLFSHYTVLKKFFDDLIKFSASDPITYANKDEFIELLNQARSNLAPLRIDPFEESSKQKKSKKARRYKYDPTKNSHLSK